MENNNSLASKPLEISYKLKPYGYKIKAVDNKRYEVVLPERIFSRADLNLKKFVIDNYLYARTRILSLVTGRPLFYQSSRPYFNNFIEQGIKFELRRIGENLPGGVKKITNELLRTQKNIFFKGGKEINKIFQSKRLATSKAILALSFGKDSSLSYGLANEIGLKIYPVTANIMEKGNFFEWKFKKKIVKYFSQKEKVTVDIFSDNVDDIFYSSKLDKRIEDLHNTNSMFSYALELLFFANYYNSAYIIFGNEKSMDDSFINNEGQITFPSYDQYSGYTKQINNYLAKAADRKIKIISLVEPIYDIAEIKILFYRYPELLKYWMSCAPENNKGKWCCECATCSEIFLYVAAVGGDPQKIGLNKNLFSQKAKELYSIFAKRISQAYGRPKEVKESQLLAFLMAYRQGWRGPLITLFKKRFLNIALRQEKIFRKKYFGVHGAATMPAEIRNKIFKIYRQELKDLS